MKKLFKETWISPNGKWKVFYQIVENGGYYSIDIVLSKFLNGHWKRYSTNKKLPNYVNKELVSIFNYFDQNYRFKKVLQISE